MRTKTLLLTAALSAAGVATSMAQTVYSVNAVGYVNVTVKPGFQMIANPLDAADNTVEALLTGIPDGTIVYKYDAGTDLFDINQYIDLGGGSGIWSITGMTLNPGEGAFIFNPTQADVQLTFVGEVVQGDISQAVPDGLSIQSSQVPQTGLLSTDLGFPVADGDIVYQFDENAQLYDINSAVDIGGGTIFWTSANGEPVLDVGEAVFVAKAASATWTRSFSVNN
jgi:hypothetical protein